jgi:hypothetical protein
MSSIGPKPVRVRLDSVAYEALRQRSPVSRRLAVSIVRHNVEPGGPPQTVSQPLRQ